MHTDRKSRSVATVLGLALAATPLVIVTTSTAAEAAKPRVFANCDAMHRVYSHGVGKPGARDKTSGKPVTTFKRSKALYNANKKSDRDKDGIACEKA
ncbi:excalibur calcium-binding domain-containing protein [Nocardioides sp. W7]|uniref:excalibur calcium-binding domain-containing protein n=1 Tax=Nocardioides sp. W7 TaxID=2931390 RepID=UPI001FD21DDD|nr:excalibur calcium-binding domain-containing protein [Nocardioides sp. W7]